MCPKLFIFKKFYLILESNVEPHHKYSSIYIIIGETKKNSN